MKKKTIIIGIVVVFILLIFINAVKNNPGGSSGGVNVSKEFITSQKVVIEGYNGHAMEPSISRDGRFLFFNSLNDGQNTSLFYAVKQDDTHFILKGEVRGVNGQVPHLDAVASMDTSNQFYFVSTRNYEKDFDNLFSGSFSGGEVGDLKAVQGDFYIRTPGWIVMDAEINPDGTTLYFVNSQFTGGAIPVKSSIGVAHKDGNKFIVDSQSQELLKNVNAIGIVYAPSISVNGLELFFTAVEGSKTTMYVAKRKSITEPFGIAEKLEFKGEFIEAPSLTSDGNTLYYHLKDGSLYTIYVAKR